MDARLQRRVQRYGWDKASTHYERYWAGQLAPAQARLLHLAAIRPGEHVLDIACGTGLVTFPAAEATGASGRVMGTDLSDSMVESLRARAAEAGLTQITAERADGEDLPFEDASFDVALCSLGLMYFPDPDRGLREMRRVLRPRGRAVAAVWGERRRCGWADIFPIVDARVQSEVCPMFFQLGTGDTLARAFARAGFGDVATDRLDTRLHYDTAPDACGAAFAGGPVALAYSRFAPEVRDAAHAEYLASIESYRAGAGYEIPGEFVLVRGVSP